MTSDRKRAANRANARASTGPRTKLGKARTAKNAVRHGLRSPVLSDPALTAEVERLVREIAGAGASTELRELAGRIAEAQIDLIRVRRARQDLLLRSLVDPDVRSPDYSCGMFGRSLPGLDVRGNAEPPAEADVTATPGGAERFARVFVALAPWLALFDRYERRARSRRKFAIRAFDLARQQSA